MKKKQGSCLVAIKGRFWVYIVRCVYGTYYTGYTNDLKRRIAMHNAGRGAKYLRGRGPVTLVYVKACRSLGTALKTECALKKKSRAEKEKLVRKDGDTGPLKIETGERYEEIDQE